MRGRHPSDSPGGLRALLADRPLVVAPFVIDALGALAAEQAGAPAVYMTGFGTAAAHGDPDVGLLGLAEMAANAGRIAAAVGVPVVADADTGYGGAVNVARTVQTYAAAGVAALHIEDQVWPKRCGFFAGKEVVGLDDMVAKVRAAVDAADPGGPVVIARTDALAPLGWDEVERRATAFVDAGAELVFVDGLVDEATARECARRLAGIPLVYNGLLPVPEVEALGFRLMLAAAPLLALWQDLRARMAALLADGSLEVGEAPGAFVEMAEALGLREAEALRARYEPPA